MLIIWLPSLQLTTLSLYTKGPKLPISRWMGMTLSQKRVSFGKAHLSLYSLSRCLCSEHSFPMKQIIPFTFFNWPCQSQPLYWPSLDLI